MPSSGHFAPSPSRPARQEPTILAATVRALVRYAEQHGVSRERSLAASGLDDEALAADDGRVPQSGYRAIWREVERQIEDPDLGLAFAESELQNGAYGVVGFLAMTSATAAEALARTVAYHPLIKGDSQMRLRGDARSVTFEETPRSTEAPWSRAIADQTLASVLVLGRRWTGGRFAATEARFQHARPRDVSGYERVLGCPVSFGQPTNALVFRRAALDLPLQTSHADLTAYLDSLARAALDKLAPGELAASVREAILGALPDGDAELPRVARRFGLSARTLQRRLEDHGLVYRDLVDDVRRIQAIGLVTSTTLPLLEISERLGYSEAKAFRRAFRRWTGLSPADLRRRAA